MILCFLTQSQNQSEKLEIQHKIKKTGRKIEKSVRKTQNQYEKTEIQYKKSKKQYEKHKISHEVKKPINQSRNQTIINQSQKQMQRAYLFLD